MKPFALAGAAGAFAVAGMASAAFTGASFVEGPSSAGNQTWRIYMNYNNPADQQLAISGNPNVAPLLFSASAAIVNNGGAFAGLKQEDFAGQPLSGPFDTYIGIGTSAFAGNDSNYSPGFLNNNGVTRVIQGSSFSEDNEGWFDGNPGTPEFGPVLVMQLTLPAGSTWTLSGTTDYNAAGGVLTSEFFQVSNIVPTPGALALLGVAGLMGARRRRK
jgi:hypothetical protein